MTSFFVPFFGSVSWPSSGLHAGSADTGQPMWLRRGCVWQHAWPYGYYEGVCGSTLPCTDAPVAIREKIFLRTTSFRSYKKWKSGWFSMSLGTCFLVIFGAVGAEKLNFWRRRRRNFGFGGGFRAISLRKNHRNWVGKPIAFEWIFWILELSRSRFPDVLCFLSGFRAYS